MNAYTRAEALRLVDEIEDEASTRYECARQVDLQLEAVLLGCNKLRALLSASDNGWRTMESAPRDGSLVILAGGELQRPIFAWWTSRDYWATDSKGPYEPLPYAAALWMPAPLPPPPNGDAE